MIPIDKLAELPRKTRLRKTVLLLQAEERELEAGKEPHREYLHALCGLIIHHETGAEELASAAEACDSACAPGSSQHSLCRRRINSLRHALLRHLGAEPAEWDLLEPASALLDGTARTVRPFRVYLEEIRSPFNVGSIFRSCEAFGVSELLLSPATASPLHPRAVKSASGAVSVVGVGGGAGALSTATAKADSAAIDTGSGEDTITNTGMLSSEAFATGDAANVSVTGVGGVSVSGNDVWDGGTLSEAQSRGLTSGDGDDHVDNYGAISATATTVTGTGAVAVTGVGGVSGQDGARWRAALVPRHCRGCCSHTVRPNRGPRAFCGHCPPIRCSIWACAWARAVGRPRRCR